MKTPMWRSSAKAVARQALAGALHRWRGPAVRLGPEVWGLDVTSEGVLAADGVALPSLRERFGSPLHVVRAGRLRANVESFRTRSSSGRSEAQVLYSYKTNPVPGVLSRLHDLGVGAEVISEYELSLALRLGVPADRIVYNGPAKSPGSIREAIRRDVFLNVNHREEIPLIAARARDEGRRARVGIRVVTSAGWAQQFGASIASGEARRAAREARDTGVLEVVGLHSHVGGMMRTEGHVRRHVAEVLDLAGALREELGLEMTRLDFGGSLATPTVGWRSARDTWIEQRLMTPTPAPSPDQTLAIEDYVRCILDDVEARYGGRPLPRVILEPGRSMTGDTQVLVATVLSLKQAEPPLPWAILDAGINLAETMRSEYHEIFPASRMRAPRDHLYRLAGPICSPGDVVSWAAPLPELRAGDALVIMDTGAYFVPSSTTFSFPRPAIVLLDEEETSLLRRAETHEDLLALDVTSEALQG